MVNHEQTFVHNSPFTIHHNSKMRYCHECGAEVAPEDIFCLYCGIALQPVSTVSAKDEKNVSENDSIGETETIEAAEQTAVTTDSPTPSAELAAVSLELMPLETSEKHQEEGQLENLLDISLETPAETSHEQIQLSTSASNAEINQGANISSIETNLDEDLQPTLIGQNANSLLPVTTPVVSLGETSEPSLNSLTDEFARVAESTPQPPDVPEEQQFASPVDIKNSGSESVSEEIAGTPFVEQIEESVVPTPNADSSPKVAAVLPRKTEANRTQETPGSKSPKLKPLSIGTLLNNRYKVVRRIGGGGMGAVYLAEDQNLGGVLRAVKEMIQAYVDEPQQEKAVADFRRESVLLTQLEHSSIPTIYDYFFDEANGRFYLVMKYISGGDLAARLRAAPEAKLDEGSVTEWAIQIADVLDYLHNRQPPIVYRDLKPSNIMLDGASNKAMLIDFGIARWVNKEEKGVTAVGTMGYAPPELFAGNAEPRSDIYSLGATMFHLLTGADPQSNPLLIFDFTKNPRPRQINLMLSVEMEDILLRSVEYNAGLRFESAAKMREALREHLDKLKAGRLTFERSSHNLAQVMPTPAQAPPAVPFASQPPVNMVFCGFCGEKIIGTDMFCAYCGAPQGAASTPPPPNAQQKSTPSQQMQQTVMSFDASGASPSAGGVATARLIVLGTSELDAPLFRLEKENNLVGREDRRANIFPEVDLSKFDNKAQVSRRHARIWREGAAYMVEDLKSSNGTVLITDNNQTVRLQALQPHVLQHGDKLKLGDTTLRFYVN